MEWGAAGSPVVLVHGAFEPADTWEQTARLLAAGHRRGGGRDQRTGRPDSVTADGRTAATNGSTTARHPLRVVVVHDVVGTGYLGVAPMGGRAAAAPRRRAQSRAEKRWLTDTINELRS